MSAPLLGICPDCNERIRIDEGILLECGCPGGPRNFQIPGTDGVTLEQASEILARGFDLAMNRKPAPET